MNWLVDGYNVILSDDKLRKLVRGDNESGRQEFLSEIMQSRMFPGDRVTVVFDGRFAASAVNEADWLVVRFTARGETADDFIKREIAESSRRRSLNVVTDDHAILDYARECGAATTRSADFISRIRGRRGERQRSLNKTEKPEPSGKPDPELLKLFTGKRK